MTNNVKDEFKDGVSVEPQTFASNPMLFLNNTESDNIGAFVVGVFLSAASFPNKAGRLNMKGEVSLNHFVDFRYEKSDKVGSITIKDGAKYKDITPAAGDILTIYCASRLFRALSQLKPGDRFYAAYQGMKKPKGGKSGAAHHFEVKVAGNLPLTADEKKHLESRKASLVEAAKPIKDTAEADAEDAMQKLVD